MKRGIISISIVVAFLLFSLPVAKAEVPGQFNYQGYLTDPEGIPIGIDPSVEVQMWFSIYDQETDGTELWSEGPVTVTVNRGIFNVNLGQTVPIVPGSVDGPCWLELIVDGGEGGEYLVPRERIVSALFAIEAKNADRVDGAEAEALEESQEITDGISAHAAAGDAHHAKTTSFAELIDMAADAQIPDDITVLSAATAVDADTASYATIAGDSDTVDGLHASEIVAIGHDHDDRYYTQAYVDTLESRMAAMETAMAEMESIVGEMLDLGQFVSVEGTDIVFSGANVHVVDGSGDTHGTHGLGNLTVGYNELRGDGTDDRTGSHNLIVGKRHNYSSYAGLVVGYENTISGAYASVSGGYSNVASGGHSSVSGGAENEASEYASSVAGGIANTASAMYASVSGGRHNEARGQCSHVSGGGGPEPDDGNVAFAHYSAILGGMTNLVGDPALTDRNIGRWSTVSGGRNNVASGDYSSVTGGGGDVPGDGNIAFAEYSAVLGGKSNLAGDPLLTDRTIGERSTVSGGYNNEASGDYASISGGASNTASGIYASISGGSGNDALSDRASILGGKENEATGFHGSVSGGYGNSAGGSYSSVSGGNNNTASASTSSVSGGDSNTASGERSSVSGGQYNVASGDYSHVSGGGGPHSGDANVAFGIYTSILGGMKNLAGDPDLQDHGVGMRATIGGGREHEASGDYSSVSGGYNNRASGYAASVSGGKGCQASGDESAVSGGNINLASGDYSSVSGGIRNTAQGIESSISGGSDNFAAAAHSSISGGYNNITDSDFGSSEYTHICGGEGNITEGDATSILGGRNGSVFGHCATVIGGDGCVGIWGKASDYTTYAAAITGCDGRPDHW